MHYCQPLLKLCICMCMCLLSSQHFCFVWYKIAYVVCIKVPSLSHSTKMNHPQQYYANPQFSICFSNIKCTLLQFSMSPLKYIYVYLCFHTEVFLKCNLYSSIFRCSFFPHNMFTIDMQTHCKKGILVPHNTNTRQLY